MAEYSANAVQTINPGEDATFTVVDPCMRGFIRHREGSGSFLLSGWVPRRSCCSKSASYLVDFGANIAIPTGEDVGEIVEHIIKTLYIASEYLVLKLK